MGRRLNEATPYLERKSFGVREELLILSFFSMSDTFPPS